MSFLQLSEISLWPALIIGASILLLDAYDIALPRGDSVGIAGALVAASVIILSPSYALTLGMASVSLVQAGRYVRSNGHASASEVWIRGAAVMAAFGAYEVVRSIAQMPPAVTLLITPAAFLACELAARQLALAVRSGRSFRRLLIGNFGRQALLFAASVSSSALAVLLFESMGAWSLLPVLALLMLIRQSYAMLLEIRDTYHTTVSVLVDIAESSNEARAGHSDRVAEIARTIGAACHLAPGELERLSYAALLHDVSGISENDGSDFVSATGSSADVVSGVGFLSEVVPILRVVDGEETGQSERDRMSGFIVALASGIDVYQSGGRVERHGVDALSRSAGIVPSRLKARAVAAAVSSGYPVPAID